MTPIETARAQLRSGAGGCWPTALRTLQTALGPAAARDAWVALLSEPHSGWSTYDPQSGRWTLYCVPGYDTLCGDFAMDCPLDRVGPQYVYAAPAGQANSTGDKVVLFLVVAGIAWFVYMLRPETAEEKRYHAAHRNRRTYAR